MTSEPEYVEISFEESEKKEIPKKGDAGKKRKKKESKKRQKNQEKQKKSEKEKPNDKKEQEETIDEKESEQESKESEEKKDEDKVVEEKLDNYKLSSDKVLSEVTIVRESDEFVPIYKLRMPKIEKGTAILLEQIKENLISGMKLSVSDLLDPKKIGEIKKKFYLKSLEIMEEQMPKLSLDKKQLLAGLMVHEMLGLGKIEMLIEDGNLEEIVVNNSKEPCWVYHKKFGWLKTNVTIDDENRIENYASSIGRRVGKQISTLHPLLDAHLISGDRANATLFPISTKGNTITIRLFRRDPWTITDLIENKTVDIESSAILWLGMQYEMNILISGGTGSGKTSFMNALIPFVPPNQRIISIEDTREIVLPDFLHWVPLTTREPNPEGKGQVDMLNLLVNSLRMRPDRIVVGEIRREKQAEVLFEAMHTGHSVYATLHADTAEETLRRLINPPINVPETLVEAIDLIVVMYRDRRSGIRRVYEIAEFMRKKNKMGVQVISRWVPKKDKSERLEKKFKFIEKIKMFTGFTDTEVSKDLKQKENILKWILKNKINTVNGVGKVVAEYYNNPEKVTKIVNKNGKSTSLVPKEWLKVI
jgi:flagellar protein FlaI